MIFVTTILKVVPYSFQNHFIFSVYTSRMDKASQIAKAYGKRRFFDLINLDMICGHCLGQIGEFTCTDIKNINKTPRHKRLYVTCRYCSFQLRHTRVDKHIVEKCRRGETYCNIPLCRCLAYCEECGINHNRYHYKPKPFRPKTPPGYALLLRGSEDSTKAKIRDE